MDPSSNTKICNKNFAQQLRKQAVKMTGRSGASHIGSCLSIADVMAVLFNDFLELNPQQPHWDERDRFILSKGHAAAILYAALAARGFIEESELETYYADGSTLMGHASHKVPGVELSTGSLGHGFPVAAGLAYAAKLASKDHLVVALLSDGECDEGSVWEAAMFAAHHKLDRLIAIIDYNKIQSLNSTFETLDLEPFADKWVSFGWSVFELDGHDHGAIKRTLDTARLTHKGPTCIILNTTKGKGVSFMENSVLWHYRSPQGEELEAAMSEVEAG